MEPVRIKVHGMIALTRRRYLILQAVAALGALALLGVWAYLRTISEEAEEFSLVARLILRLRDWIPWVVILLLAALAVETCLVLRKFAQEQASDKSAPF